jgi:branched-chain amino acid transport system permease protein
MGLAPVLTRLTALFCVVAGALLVIAVPFVVDRFYLNLAYLIAVFLIITVGLNVLIGYTGVVSLGHAGLMAVGAYASSVASTSWGVPVWLSMFFGVVAAALIGGALGYVVLRSGGVYLALMTIAFGTVVHEVLIRWTSVTGGPLGISGVPALSLFGHDFGLTETFYAAAIVAGLALWFTYNLRRSGWGRRMLAVKADEIASRSLGVNPLLVRSTAFTFSAILAGAAGTLYAHGNSFVSPDTFGTVASIQFVLMALLGGAGYVLGPLVGTGLLIWLSEALSALSELRLALYGAILLAVLYVLPKGILGSMATHIRRFRHNGGPAVTQPPVVMNEPAGSKAPVVEQTALEEDQEPLLNLVNVSKSFGGTKAIQGLGLELRAGTVHALIGPNGAGKSTVLNLVSGHYEPDEGEILLCGEEIQNAPAEKTAHLGIARTFQHSRLFPDLTVIENVMVAAEESSGGSIWAAVFGLPSSRRRGVAARAVAERCLDAVGFTGRRQADGAALSYGEQKLVEIARALATGPKVILLDEPAAGLNAAERERLGKVIVSLREAGLSMILVEHHMEFVSRVSDYVTVIDYGKRLAEGVASSVKQDPRVIEAYLGAEVAS